MENEENKILLEWQAPEYDATERTPEWFYWLGGLALVAVFICILLKNFLLAIIIVLATFSTIMYEIRPPRLQTIRITGKGIMINNELFPFKNINYFAISHGRPNRHLIINTKRFALSRIHISLSDTPADKIKQTLSPFLKEVEYEENILDQISDRLGF